MKQRQGGGEEKALKKKEKHRGCMYENGKGHVHTVYSQMSERMTGEVMKNHFKKQKREATSNCESEFAVKSSFCFFWSFVFSPFSRDFANSYPAVPPS